MIDDVPDNTPVPPVEKPDALAAVKAPAAKVAVALGLVPSGIDEAWRLAQNLAETPLVPADYFKKPHSVLLAVMLGAELGLPPVAALQSIAVVKGKPTLYGDGLLAVIQKSPLYTEHAESYAVGGVRRDRLDPADLLDDTTAAVCSFWRRGHVDPTTREFSIADAKRAGLWGKDNWAAYPARMLRMRARSWAARDTFADVLRGLHAAEEAIDEPDNTPPAPRRVPRLSDAADDRHGFGVDRTPDTRHDPTPAPAVEDPF